MTRGIERLEPRTLLAAGGLDPAFGSGGSVTSDFAQLTDDSASDVVVQKDGRFVVVGRAGSESVGGVGVVRYLPDGSLDDTFGVGGRVRIDVHGVPSAVALQRDGKIVIAGALSGDFAVWRLNPDGSLDTSFGFTGVITTDIAGRDDTATDLAVQRDGRIVVGGTAESTEPGSDYTETH